MNIAGMVKHLVAWREWELNPIVVKELRQAVRSWAVTGMLMIFLLVLFIISLGFLIFQSMDVNADTELGSKMFSCFSVILAAASVLFIPLYLGIRVASERQENNPDLFYVSTLSPMRIIRGKFLCGAYMALLFFSACMPFMAFTNLLRGVDLPTVFFILFFLFLVVCVANMTAICLACIPASRPFKVLFALIGFISSFWLVVPVISYSFIFAHSGIATTMGDRDFWIAALTAIAIAAGLTGLFFVLAVGLVSPPSANRALPIRIYITAIWLLGGLLSLGLAVKTRSSNAILIWTDGTFVLMILCLLAVISNSDKYSHRTRRAIPRALWKRFFAFFFFNGAAGGILWVSLILVATAALAASYSGNLEVNQDWTQFVVIAAYIFAYALTALFIQRTFLAARPPKLAGLLTALVAAVFALIPSIILFFLNKLTWASIEGLELGNVFNVFSMRDDHRLIDHVYFAFGWLVLVLAVNALWFFRQVRDFTPPPKEMPPIIV